MTEALTLVKDHEVLKTLKNIMIPSAKYHEPLVKWIVSKGESPFNFSEIVLPGNKDCVIAWAFKKVIN